MKILKNCSEKQGMTVFMVTHDPDFDQMAQRRAVLADGKLVNE